jgi:hypothetical protein
MYPAIIDVFERIGKLAVLSSRIDFPPTMSMPEKNEFEQSSDEPSPSLVQEFLQFIVENKKWWLIPILISFGLIGLLVALSSTGAAPFIYTLF